YGVHIVPYLNFLISVYTLIVAYAMVKHHLMDINVVIKKTLLYSVISVGLASIYTGVITLLAFLIGSHENSLFSIPYPFTTGSALWNWLVSSVKQSFSNVCVATALLSTAFGLFVLAKGYRRKVNILWCIFCITVAVWGHGLGMVTRSAS